MVDFIQGIQPKLDENILFGDMEFRFGAFYNIFGKNKTGKTAFCFYMADKSLKNNHDTLYIETEGKLNTYEAVHSKSYNFEKMIFPTESIFKFFDNKNPKGELFLDADFSNFKKYLETLIKQKNIKVIIIDSITHPLKNLNPKTLGKIITDFFYYFYDDIILKYGIMGIITSHSREDYVQSENEKQIKIEIPRGSRKSKFIPNKTIQTIAEYQNQEIDYFLVFHDKKIPFKIESDGSIQRIG